MFDKQVPLIDVNMVTDDELERQQLLGIMAGALKHSRDRDIKRYLIRLMENLNTMDLSDDLALQFIRTVFNYLLGTGNATNVEQFIQEGWRLREPIRGEMMTIAEQLQAMGEEKAREEIALRSLREGADPRFVERITGLELSVILKLKKALDGE
jgi:hypothetical protein